MSNMSPHSGYSKKFKKYQGNNAYPKETNQLSPKIKIKLEPLTPLRFKSNNSDNVLFDSINKIVISNSPLTKVIEDKSQEYESAIMKHLKIRTFSREKEQEDLCPLTNIKTNSPSRFQFSHDNSLKSVDTQPKKSPFSVRMLDGLNQSMKIREKNLSQIPNFDLNENKLIKLRSSIEDMRALLKKLKK